MPRELIPSFLFYCYVTSITPGPSNLATLSVSLNCGKQRALRQWYGMATGFIIDAMFAVSVVCLLGKVAGEYVRCLSYVGAAYIAYLAIRLLRSGDGAGDDNEMPDGFRTGLLIQVTNAKGILYCITALSSYVRAYNDSLLALFLTGCFLMLTAPLCNLVWLYVGVSLQGIFQKYRRLINIAMAAALLLCAVNLAMN